MEISTKKKHKIYINNISQATKEEDLRNHFKKYGEINDCFISRVTYNNTRNNGFANIEFKDSNSIKRALKDAHIIHNKKLKISKFDEEKWTLNKRKVYLDRIPNWISKEILKDFFFKFGEIEECEVNTSGGGFIVFKDLKDAKKVTMHRFLDLNGVKFKILKKREINNTFKILKNKPMVDERGMGVGGKTKNLDFGGYINFVGAFSYDNLLHSTLYDFPHFLRKSLNFQKEGKNKDGQLDPEPGSLSSFFSQYPEIFNKREEKFPRKLKSKESYFFSREKLKIYLLNINEQNPGFFSRERNIRELELFYFNNKIEEKFRIREVVRNFNEVHYKENIKIKASFLLEDEIFN